MIFIILKTVVKLEEKSGKFEEEFLKVAEAWRRFSISRRRKYFLCRWNKNARRQILFLRRRMVEMLLRILFDGSSAVFFKVRKQPSQDSPVRKSLIDRLSAWNLAYFTKLHKFHIGRVSVKPVKLVEGY